MFNHVSAQTAEFLYSALLGIFLGVLYDIVRVLRSYISKKQIITAVLDMLFWIIAIIALLAFVLIICGGKMRLYVLFGTFCGAFVYTSALGEIVFNVLHSVIAVLQRLLRLSTRPIYLLLRAVWRAGKKVERNAEKKVKEKMKKKYSDKRKAGINGNKKAKKA